VADILKFPWPLFPKYKKTFPIGFRFEIGGTGDHTYELTLPPGNKYELQSFVLGCSKYNDSDYYSLYRNDDVIFSRIYTKDLGQVLEIRPIVVVDPSVDTVRFTFTNTSGIPKTVWIDLSLTSNKVVSNTTIPDQTPIPISMKVIYNGITDGSDTHQFISESFGNFDAIATYSDGTTKNVTAYCNWVSETPNLVVVTDTFTTDTYHRKIVQFVGAGTGYLQAEYMGVSGSYYAIVASSFP
jgi:hypothetical protein